MVVPTAAQGKVIGQIEVFRHFGIVCLPIEETEGIAAALDRAAAIWEEERCRVRVLRWLQDRQDREFLSCICHFPPEVEHDRNPGRASGRDH